MARRPKGNVVNGWFVLDKPTGMTSTHAVAAVKRAFDAQKAGHAGTLDPLATGILPIALGEATKTVPFAVDGAKAYRFTVAWGAETNTDDAEGVVTATSPQRPQPGAITALLPRFIGTILQTPPAFSAIKIDGERAYDLARKGEAVVIEPREVTITALRIVQHAPDGASTVFETECGKGTYVRALARDLGRLLGCHGHVTVLRRTRVGAFTEARAVTLDRLRLAAFGSAEPPPRIDVAQLPPGTPRPPRAPVDLVAAKALLEPVEMALEDITGIVVSSSDAGLLARGKSLLLRGRDAPMEPGPAYAMCKGRLVALGEIDKGALHPSRVFHLD
jgi:tRNA pseudouridine55 synthase